VLFDLDRFKSYNDSLGHLAGDAALRCVASVLQGTARAADIVCRYGGEEFVVLMPEQAIEGAAQAAERLRDAVERLELRYPTRAGQVTLTISAGVALLGREAARDADDVLRAADAALYCAKGMGRNRVATTAPSAHHSVRARSAMPRSGESPFVSRDVA
jgi:diguanylate cyclase (GGDEF)-like protein